jgi:hypothetical protein
LGKDVTSEYASRNWMIADVYPDEGETLTQALKRTIGMASPTLADKLTKTPTEADIERVKLSSLLWSKAPQLADKTDTRKISLDAIKEKLKEAYVLNAALPLLKQNPPKKPSAYNPNYMTDIQIDRSTVSSADIAVKYLKQAGNSDTDVDQLVKKAEADALKDASSVVLEETSNGHISPVLPGRLSSIAGSPKFLNVSVTSQADVIVDQILGATISRAQRLLQGNYNGTASGTTDFSTGGGDYIFSNLGGANSNYTDWGNVRMMFDPSEADRLDIFCYTTDGYGVTKEDSATWKNRPTVEDVGTGAQEVMLRRGINSRKLLRVGVPTQALRNEVLSLLQSKGVTKVNGISVEDLVIANASTSELYQQTIKPAGY